MISMENPKCNRCKKEWKPDETDIKKNGDVNKTCKNCREYYENNKEKNKKQRKENKKERYKKNKEKLVEYNKERYENNKEKKAEYNKEYHKNNKEQRAEYRENNKEKLKEQRAEYRENSKCEHNKIYGYCEICNLSLYLVNLNRCAVRRCLKLSSQNKTKSSINYMGCDVEYFRDYFKKKMDLWNENKEIKMNWNNIHLDHIKPVSVFNLDDEDELNKCCNYTNFQPLLATDNLNKHNKWTDEDEVYWNENIKGKEHFGIYMPV